MNTYNDYEGPDGWFNLNDVRVYKELLEKLPDEAVIAELGVAKGRSLCSVADVIKRKKILVYAVDTFGGTENEGEAHADAKTTDWEKIFRDNLRSAGINGQVSTRKGRTDEVCLFSEFQSAGGFFDLIFVDADHSTEAVKKDIENWKPLLKPTGILAGHDFGWPSVREALFQSGLRITSDQNMWFVLP